jgi:hypothetical protein
MKKKKAFLLLFWVFLAHLNSNQAFLIGAKVEIGPPRAFLHYESRPRFNSNQAFLLVQKLKSAPKGFFTLEVRKFIDIRTSTF